jgi:predicted metal-dependent hydrolase
VGWRDFLIIARPPRQLQSIVVDGEVLTLIMQRKDVKNVNARLRDSTLFVSAPRRMPQETVDSVVQTLARTLIRRAHAKRVNGEEDALSLARRVAERFPTPLRVDRVEFVTTQTSCWGTYSTRTQTVRLNATLRAMPIWVLEAVVAHELAHMAHPNHSSAFWSLTRQVCPNTDRAQAFLLGVSWLGQHWERLPQVERVLLGSRNEIDSG